MGRGYAGLVCAFAAATVLAAAPVSVSPARAGPDPASTAAARHGVERVRFWHYGVEDGLSQSTARVLVQDRQGFVWIGTQDGLNRFDGQEFRVYRNDSSDPLSLPDNYITALAPAPDGTLWVGTQAGGLARYRPLRDDFLRQSLAADGAAGSRIAALMVDAGGRLWVASAGAGLAWFDPERGTMTAVPAAAGVAFGQVRGLRPRH